MIHGFNKTTLLDYPGHLAATIFLGGCNFRCPFCHNASLVLAPNSQPIISKEEVLSTLRKRIGILEGVCITGGEPSLYPGLIDLTKEIKDLGFLVKLDTNGTNPNTIKYLLESNLIDYIAMDIKNCKEKYSLSSGIKNTVIDKISESISLLINSNIDYEFRTTVVKNLHDASDFIKIGEWIEGANAYFLQAYRDSEDIIKKGLSGHSLDELKEFKEIVSPYVKEVSIRKIE
ncbi:MAG: anaerobic ribonucleoside-triphosphate reductase activating protein [Clostridiales bacterium]|nr:anaerobic ribonucleoside-triphosphate reductase activating protein [Clostridiales bacterium]